MRALFWMTCLWPGLAALWLRGRPAGLLLAVLFGAVLNLALLAPLVLPIVPGLPPGAVPLAAWVLVLGFWGLGVWLGSREVSRQPAGPTASDPQLDEWFREAQNEYLKGHWIEAETLLGRLLAREPGDVEARLLLAGLLRRTRRFGEALEQLRQLAANPRAARWTFELESERQLVEARPTSAATENTDDLEYPPLAKAA